MKIDERLEIAKKKFLIDWKNPDRFSHIERMLGAEKLFQKYKREYLNSITVGDRVKSWRI